MKQLTLDRKAGQLTSQIYRYFRDQILEGNLAAGAGLAPTRSLAEEIKVSRNTVLLAYEQLAAEGYVAPRQGSGYFVTDVQPLKASTAPAKKRRIPTSRLAERVAKIPPAYIQRHRGPRSRYDFIYGEPSYDNFPHAAWARTLGKIARNVTAADLSYPEYLGTPALRNAIAGYLHRARGVTCSPEDVLIVHGTQDAIDLCCRLLLNEGDGVVCEHPFYRGFVKAARAAGADIQFVPTDNQGLQTQALPDSARLAFVTPSHQFPSGGVLPVSRRLELLDWARRKRAIVFEDDYDSEFRYAGPAIDSLQSLDDHGNVVYVGTASKTFFPALRLGWMVMPRSLRERLIALRGIADTTPPTLEQLALAEFINSGQFERHILRARKRYASMREQLLQAINATCGDRVQIQGGDSGIHLLVRLPSVAADYTDGLIARCAAKGVLVRTSAAYYRRPPRCVELVVGYSAINQRDMAEGATLLAAELTRTLNL